jgi:hypothetical protein
VTSKKRPKIKYDDFPFTEAFEQAQGHRRVGSLIYQKWTCAGCGARLSGEPNHWTTQGRCDEVEGSKGCGHITDLVKSGCNFAVIMTLGPTANADALLDKVIADMLRKKGMH